MMTPILIALLLILMVGGYFGWRGRYYGGGMLTIIIVGTILLGFWMVSNGAHAAETTVTASAPTSASTTISLLPLWLQMIPYIASGVGTLVVALCGWVAFRVTGIQVSKDTNSRLQQAATNAAGRVLAQLSGPIGGIKIGADHPLIVQEANRLAATFATTIENLGWTPDKVSALILGKIGQLQASAPASPLSQPTTTGRDRG